MEEEQQEEEQEQQEVEEEQEQKEQEELPACLLVCLFMVLLPWSSTQWAASYLRSSSGLSCFWPWQLTLLNGSPVAT